MVLCGFTWLYMVIRGFDVVLHGSPGYAWLYMVVHCCIWFYVVLHGLPGYTWPPTGIYLFFHQLRSWPRGPEVEPGVCCLIFHMG